MRSLDYRPIIDVRAQRALVRAMQVSAGLNWGKVIFGLAMGLAATTIVSAFISGLITAVIVRIWPDGPEGLLFLGVFLLLTAWAIRAAWRRQANPLEDELTGFGASPSSYGEWELRSATAAVWLYAEVLLWGPRTLVWACTSWRNQGRLPEIPLERAADVLLMLTAVDGGVDISELLLAGDSPQGMRRLLGYLKSTDWIDTGSKGKRVWLTSPARKRIHSILHSARERVARSP